MTAFRPDGYPDFSGEVRLQRLPAKKKGSSKVPENMETAQFHQIGLLHKEVK